MQLHFIWIDDVGGGGSFKAPATERLLRLPGMMGPYGWELGCWWTPVNKYIQVSGQRQMALLKHL